MITTKILLVDDDEGMSKTLDAILSDDGFDVISANNGASALERIFQERPDLVLLDLLMPGLNGYAVLREIRDNPTTKNLPVIMMTAVHNAKSEQIAFEMGANYYVTKPWKLEILQATIRVALTEVGKSVSDKHEVMCNPFSYLPTDSLVYPGPRS